MKTKTILLKVIMLLFVAQGAYAQPCAKRCKQKCSSHPILLQAQCGVANMKTDADLQNMLNRDNVTVREIKDSVPSYYDTWWNSFRKKTGIKPYYIVSKNWDYMDSKIKGDHYASELKYKVYTMSDEYKMSIDTMKQVGDLLMNYTIAYKDQPVTFLSKYDMETKLYTVWVEETDFVYNPRSTDEVDDKTVVFASVPVKKNKYIEIPVLSEEDALYLENNREKLKLLTIFQVSDQLSKKYVKSKYIGYLPISLKARVILYDCTTGKIFYSKLFDKSKKRR